MEYLEQYKNLLNYYLDNLDETALFKSLIHGKGHIERVIKLGAAIAQNEEMNENETSMLLLCCAYHDIGRKNDLYDTKHGSRSADKLAKGAINGILSSFCEEDANIIKASISAHSDIDTNIEYYIEKYKIKNKEKFYKIATCLKDADNLDRVRLGDFDEKYLRHEKSHQLIPYAYELISHYKKIFNLTVNSKLNIEKEDSLS